MGARVEREAASLRVVRCHRRESAKQDEEEKKTIMYMCHAEREPTADDGWLIVDKSPRPC